MEDLQERDDLEKVNLAKGGDLRAFDALVLRYQGMVSALLFRFAAQRADLEDLVQETFIRAFRNVAGSRAESSPALDVRAALQKELIRTTAERFGVVSCLLDMVTTWRLPGALAAAVGVIGAVSIFVLRDAPGFLSDPIFFLLTNR